MLLLAIDPGPKHSGYVIVAFYRNLYDGAPRLIAYGVVNNTELLKIIYEHNDLHYLSHVVVEEIQGYGMAVGKNVFDSAKWAGRFIEAAAGSRIEWSEIGRREVKLNICNDTRAKKKNVNIALIDRKDPDRKYGKHGKGTKKKPGPFYGFSNHIWDAYALAITWIDFKSRKKSKER